MSIDELQHQFESKYCNGLKEAVSLFPAATILWALVV